MEWSGDQCDDDRQPEAAAVRSVAETSCNFRFGFATPVCFGPDLTFATKPRPRPIECPVYGDSNHAIRRLSKDR